MRAELGMFRLALCCGLLALAAGLLAGCTGQPAPEATPVPTLRPTVAPTLVPTLRPTVAPTPKRCNTGTTEADWVGREFWLDADLVQVERELHCGANVNAENIMNGATPLHYATANSGNPAVVQALLDAGADIYAYDYEGRIPRDYAVDNENTAVIDLLR